MKIKNLHPLSITMITDNMDNNYAMNAYFRHVLGSQFISHVLFAQVNHSRTHKPCYL